MVRKKALCKHCTQSKVENNNKTILARSYNMSRIRNKDTKPEVMVRKYLFGNGFRYKKNVSNLPGKPDIVLPKYRAVIFVNGCFWHRHLDCKYFVWPKTNKEFWVKKLNENCERDEKNYSLLRNRGWRVMVVWECELRREVRQEKLQDLVDSLRCLQSSN